MKIVLVSHLFPNSAAPVKGTFVLEKAQALARYAEVVVCAPAPCIPLWRPPPRPRETIGKLTILHAPYPALPAPLFRYRWRAYYRALEDFFRQYPPPDILMADWVYPDAYALMHYRARHALTAPLILTAHGANAIGYYSRASRTECFAMPLRQADRVIAVSADLKGKIVSVAGIADEKIMVINNGVDPELFHPRPRRAARARLNIEDDRPLIVAVARLAPEKALHLLLRALHLSQSRQSRLAIIGEGPQRRRLQRMVRRLRLEERVRFTGNLPRADIPLWLAAADVLALSSLHEGDPVVIRESLACGTPVVAACVGGIPEVLGRGANYGLLCDPNDSLQLAHCLDRALAREWNREELAQYGQSHSWDNVARRLTDVCRELLAS